MAGGVKADITPWRRRSLTIPPASLRDWCYLAIWEIWMGMLLCGFLSFGAAMITTSPTRIVTAEDLSRCYQTPVVLPCERIIYRTGALNAAFTALGGMVALLVAAWFVWELWGVAAPRPISDDFLKLLNDSFGRKLHDPRTWPWTRIFYAYGFTVVGSVLAAVAGLLVWSIINGAHPAKAPIVKVNTSQDFRVAQ